MLIIPSDLPKALYPLAWLVGQWQGYGVDTGVADTSNNAPTKTRFLVQEVNFIVEADYLRQVTKTWETVAESDTGIPVGALPAEALKILRPVGDPIWEESTRWAVSAVNESPEIDPATGRSTVSAELEVISEGGIEQDKARHQEIRWTGVSQGPRISLTTGTEESHRTRIYGFVNSDLMWAQDLTDLEHTNPVNEGSYRLAKVVLEAETEGQALGEDNE